MERIFGIVVGRKAEKVSKDGEDKFYNLCKKIVSDHSLEIYDLDYFNGNSVVRVYIVNPLTGTATIDECVLVNRSFGVILEEEEWLPSSTILEISSPGVARRLSRRCHFVEVLGKDIVVVLKEAVEWAKKGEKIIGKVLAVEDGEIRLGRKGQTLSLAWEMIKKANLQEEIKV